MTKSFTKSQTIGEPVFSGELTTPLQYLSSADAGWEGLQAQAFHEPTKLDGWITTPLPEIALVLFAGGSMRLAQRRGSGLWKTRYLSDGDLLLTPGGGVSHEVRWNGLSNLPMRTLHLHLSNELVARTAEEVIGCAFDHLTIMDKERSVLRDPLLASLGFALWRDLEQHSPTGKLYAETAAQMLTVHLLRRYMVGGKAVEEPAHGLTNPQIRRVLAFIDAHLDQDLSLKALAQQTGFSPYYFARLFRQATGQSPHRFVLRQRIARAERLLRETDKPLADVATETGFANQSHLTQVFKQHCGLTPRAYRHER